MEAVERLSPVTSLKDGFNQSGSPIGWNNARASRELDEAYEHSELIEGSGKCSCVNIVTKKSLSIEAATSLVILFISKGCVKFC